jgi:hypothetical protein
MGTRFYELIFLAALYVFAIFWWVRVFRRASTDGLKVISGPYDETIRILAELPRPRPIRISSKGKWITLIVLVVPLAVFIVAAYEQHRHPTPGMTMEGLLEFFGIMAVLMGAFLWLPPYLRASNRTSNSGSVIRNPGSEPRWRPDWLFSLHLCAGYLQEFRYFILCQTNFWVICAPPLKNDGVHRVTRSPWSFAIKRIWSVFIMSCIDAAST